MARKTFLFSLPSADKKPLYVDDATGHVLEGDAATFQKPGGQPATLRHDPSGWKDMLVKYARNNKYLGVFRDMTVSVKFVGDGAKILRNRMWMFGMECICFLAISKLDRLNYPYKYEPWYAGELDFSKFKQNNTEVTINVMEGGPIKYLKAFESTVYEIPIDTNPNKKTVYLDGLPFTNTVSYTIYKNQEVYGNHTYIGAGIIANEGTTQGIITQDAPAGIAAFGNSEKDFFYIRSENKNITVNIKGTVKFQVNTTGHIVVAMQRAHNYSASSIVAFNNYDIFNASATAGTIITQDFDFTFSLSNNEFVMFRTEPNLVPSAAKWYTILDGNYDVTYEVKFAPSFAECLTPFNLFEQLALKMTDGKYRVKSTFLQTLESELLLTSGPALRKYGALAVIKSSMASFFKSMQRYGVGFGIEGDFFIIEKHDYFFKNSVAYDLGPVDKYDVSVAEDLVINTIKAGYKNQEIDKINGRDEVNVSQSYTTPHTRVVKELDLVSDYRADMYGIEVTRIDLAGQDTTDNKADNDVFMLSVSKGADYVYFSGDFATEVVSGAYFIKLPGTLTQFANGTTFTISGAASNNGTYTITNTSYLLVGYTYITVAEPLTAASLNGSITGTNPLWYKLKRPAYTSVTGVLHANEGFNYELSPKRAVLNNGAYIHSILDYLDIKQITFTTGEKNSELSTTLAGVTITENANIPIGSLPPKLFLPYYFSFTTAVPVNLLKIMETRQYEKIAFTINGDRYEGYLWDGGIKPGTNDKQVWKVLSAPNNVMTKFINNA